MLPRSMPGPGDSDTRRVVNRRELLHLGAGGVSAALAGCAGPQYEPILQQPDIEQRQQYVDAPDDRVFKTPLDMNPADVSPIWDFTPRGSRHRPSERLFRVTHEPGLWGRWWSADFWHEPGPMIPQLYEGVDIGEETVSIRIRDDAVWSDGQPVRAYDILATVAAWRMPRPPLDEVGWTPTPAEGSIIDAVGSYSLPEGEDGRRIDLHLQDSRAWREIGGFEALPRGELLYQIGGPTPRLGVRFPTHVEPYTSIATDAVQDFDERTPDARSVAALAMEHVTEEDVMRFRRPDAFVSTGPWTLERFVGAQAVVLGPNEHHRHADDLEIESVVLEFLAGHRLVQELRQGIVDYASAWVSESQREFLSDSLERRFSPGWFGRAVGVDHSSVFGDPLVRQAILHALDIPAMLEAFDIPGIEPVDIPGGRLWNAAGYLGADWIDDTLLSYEQDRDRSRELLEAAGFEQRSDDRWVRDGTALTGELVSDRGNHFTAEFRAQLATVGIDVEVYPVDLGQVELPGGPYDTPSDVVPMEAGWDILEERWAGDDTADRIQEDYGGRGEVALWQGDEAADRLAGTVSALLDHWVEGVEKRRLVRARNYFDHEAQEAAIQDYRDSGRRGADIGAWEDWTIEVPPIGEPDGERRPFNPAYTAGQVLVNRRPPSDPQPDNPYYDPPRDSRHAENATYFWRTFAWVANWWLPVLPLIRLQRQHFYEADRWEWPPDQDDEGGRGMWDHFGNGWTAVDLLAMNRVV